MYVLELWFSLWNITLYKFKMYSVIYIYTHTYAHMHTHTHIYRCIYHNKVSYICNITVLPCVCLCVCVCVSMCWQLLGSTLLETFKYSSNYCHHAVLDKNLFILKLTWLGFDHIYPFPSLTFNPCQAILSMSSVIFFFNLFIHFCQCWVFMAVCRLFLATASGATL